VRAFISHFWTLQDRTAPQLRVIEVLPVTLLLAACVALAAAGEPALRFTREAAAALHAPRQYTDAIMGARTVRGPAAGEAR
jgi:multicomponent K+:H+ antiporter subunit D